MKRTKMIGIALASGIALTGCMSSPLTYSASSIPIEQGRYSVLAEDVTGTNTQVNWLFFTFGLGGSGQRHALSDALEQVPGADALVAMSVDTEFFMLVPFALPSFYTTRVSGTPVKVNSGN
jgi:hypothetical protein